MPPIVVATDHLTVSLMTRMGLVLAAWEQLDLHTAARLEAQLPTVWPPALPDSHRGRRAFQHPAPRSADRMPQTDPPPFYRNRRERALGHLFIAARQLLESGAYDQGRKALQRGAPDPAIAAFTQAIADDPDRSHAYTGRALAHLTQGRRKEAAADLEMALDRDPLDIIALVERARLRFEAGDPAMALPELDRALAITELSVPPLRLRGQVYLALKQHNAALADFDQAARLAPTDAMLAIDRGYALLHVGRPAEAADAFETALSQDARGSWASPTVRALIGLGTSRYRLGQATEAADLFTRALQQLEGPVIDPSLAAPSLAAPSLATSSLPSSPLSIHRGENTAALAKWSREYRLQAILGRALAHSQGGAFGSAIQDFTRAAQLVPDRPDIYHNRGLAHLATNQMSQAIADFDRALTMAPGSGESLFFRGLAYGLANRHRDAIADYDRVTAMLSGHVGAYRNRAVARIRLGDTRAACRDADQACRLGLCDVQRWLQRHNQCNGPLPSEDTEAGLRLPTPSALPPRPLMPPALPSSPPPRPFPGTSPTGRVDPEAAT